MSILKLIPGQRIHFTVSAVEQVEGNYGPQYKFDGATPDDANATLFLNVSTAERQLDRIGYSLTSVVGQTVEIARTEKNGTKYTDINRVNGAVTPRAAAPSQPKQGFSSGGPLPYETETGGAPAEPKTAQWDKLFAAYDVCMDKAISVARKMESAQIGSDPSAVAAMAATLLIQADRQGLTR